MASVTVLMPVYNAQAFLRPAIESILAQSFSDFEFLVINDGSTDTSRDIIASYPDPRIRLVDNPHNLGLTHTLNRGLEMAQGDLIARQDADDVSHTRRLELQLRYLERHPEVALLGTQGCKIDRIGRSTGAMDRPQEHLSIRWHHLFDNAFLHTSVVFRRDLIWGRLRGYRPYDHCEDYELWSRVMSAYPVANLPDRLVERRVHPESVIGAMEGAPNETTARLIREVMERDLQALFEQHVDAEEAAHLLSRFRLGLNEVSFAPFMDCHSHLLKGFIGEHPQLRASRDFRRTVARQYARISRDLLSSNPWLSCRACVEVLRTDPSLSLSIPWRRILAELLAGRGGQGPQRHPIST